MKRYWAYLIRGVSPLSPHPFRHRAWALSLVVMLLVAACSHDASTQGEEALPLSESTTAEELGRRLAPMGLDLTGLSPAETAQVLQGSYLVNGVGSGCGCHTTEAGYLAGGEPFLLPFSDLNGRDTVFSRNLTPDPETGLDLTEDEFIEALQTGKDFDNSDGGRNQRFIIMPWQVFRFMSREDLRSIYAYLQRIPPVVNDIAETFAPPFPFAPIPLPAIGDGDTDAGLMNAERGLLIPQLFSEGPDADAFAAHVNDQAQAADAETRQRIGRGSYLVNAIAACTDCHTDGSGDGNFDAGLLPMTVHVNTAAYLAGGVDMGPFSAMETLWSRNITPDATTGMDLTEEQFIQAMMFGADFSRPGGSLRIRPHFPAHYIMTLSDFRAIYTYLRSIPAVINDVEIIP